MSTYIKTKADQKRKLNSTYQDKLFIAAAQVLPAVVLHAPPETSEVELVDTAVTLARSLLAELGYKYLAQEEKDESR